MSDASDSEDAGAGEFANVINEMNNAPGNGNGGGEEVDEEEDADDAGIGVQGLPTRGTSLVRRTTGLLVL